MNDQTPQQATVEQLSAEQLQAEQLSALMDAELPNDQLRFLLRRIDGDASLAQRWSRYHIASMTLQRRYVHFVPPEQFAAAVMARVDAEPMDAEPMLAVPRRRAGVRVLRWAGGGAIAAAVAVVALVVSRPVGESTTLSVSPTTANSIVANQLVPNATGQNELRTPVLQQQPMLPAGFADYAQPASFESFLPTYAAPALRAQSSGNTGNGFVPYVLVAGSRQQTAGQQAVQDQVQSAVHQ